ncbi:MAG: cation:proton antiporter [Clostridia bacterium]|nr:cation:proton antiporter [Clostridia bacterium]
MELTILSSLSIALAAGLLLTRLTKRLGLPDVTAYLIAGIFIGPFGLGLLQIEGIGFTSLESVSHMKVLSDVALGFIAFAMGNEFRVSRLKSIGKQAVVIAVFQAVVAALCVDVCLIAVHFIVPEALPLEAAIVLGSIAAATPPAANLMVVRQYKADGPVTRMLLPVVALDDAVGLIVFSVSYGIAQSMASGEVNVVSTIAEPAIEIVASLLLGFVMGLLFTLSERFFHSNSKRLAISITFVFVTAGISLAEFDLGAVSVSFSPLLSCMMLGTVFCNKSDFSEELMERVDKWTVPLFILFFVISGAELELNVLTDLAIVGIGAAYILSRSFGKLMGARVSSSFMKCDPTIRKYLGITLLPQAGVALGMTVTAQNLPGCGSLIRNIVLMSVLIYEIVGPLLTKTALKKAGEIRPKPDVIPNKVHTARRTNTL